MRSIRRCPKCKRGIRFADRLLCSSCGDKHGQSGYHSRGAGARVVSPEFDRFMRARAEVYAAQVAAGRKLDYQDAALPRLE